MATYRFTSLADARKKLGLTQAELARRWGVTRQTVANQEHELPTRTPYLLAVSELLREKAIADQLAGMGIGSLDRAKPSTYVLILKPAEPGGWPAVVGGYPTREQADAAGREATMADLSDEIEEKFDGIAPIGNAKFHAWRWRSWIAFTVIPGAAQC